MSNENRQKPLLTDIPTIATIRSEEAGSRTEQMADIDDCVAPLRIAECDKFVDYRFTENIRGHFRYIGTHKNSTATGGAKTMQQRVALTVEVVF